MTNKKYCKDCKIKIKETKRANAIYCSNRCAQRKYSKNNREKYGKVKVSSNTKIIMDFFGYKCEICKSKENIGIHYKTPLEFGGKNIMSNIHLLCEKCVCSPKKKPD